MEELIDYAGLFPPAALPLKEALLNYHSYINGVDSWMLGPFVIPASRLYELEPFKDKFNDQYPLRLSVILTKSEEIETDLHSIQKFLETYQTAGTVDSMEVPLPSDVGIEFLQKLEKQTENYPVYCEVTGTNDQLLNTLDSIQAIDQKSFKRFGVKIRMGGTTANLFPTVQQAAFMIHECQKRGLALKFTAGLHHPIRQYREEVETFMHGFVNVFTASIMAYCHSVDSATIQSILRDESLKNFSFTKDTLSWRNFTVSSSEIKDARNFFAASYGSCSFDEPREELGELNIFQGEKTR
jgi:cell division FtsZ-interacting protein ZapD